VFSQLLRNSLLTFAAAAAVIVRVFRGQSIKVFSQLLRKARQRGFILPYLKVGGQGAGQDGVAYEGATVLEPKIGACVVTVTKVVTWCCCCLGSCRPLLGCWTRTAWYTRVQRQKVTHHRILHSQPTSTILAVV
jgi:hypothetical protein